MSFQYTGLSAKTDNELITMARYTAGRSELEQELATRLEGVSDRIADLKDQLDTACTKHGEKCELNDAPDFVAQLIKERQQLSEKLEAFERAA